MKKLIHLPVVVILVILTASTGLKATPVASKDLKADTTIDPKKGPFSVDLDKHPEIMTKVQDMIKSGKVRIVPGSNIDTALDLSKHPELVKAIIKNPANWPIILKAYDQENQSATSDGKQVIRDIIAYLIREHIVNSRQEIDSFLLNDTEFMVNGKKLSEERHNYLKQQYILRPGYVVYFGNSEMKGDGIFQRTDNL